MTTPRGRDYLRDYTRRRVLALAGDLSPEVLAGLEQELVSGALPLPFGDEEPPAPAPGFPPPQPGTPGARLTQMALARPRPTPEQQGRDVLLQRITKPRSPLDVLTASVGALAEVDKMAGGPFRRAAQTALGLYRTSFLAGEGRADVVIPPGTSFSERARIARQYEAENPIPFFSGLFQEAAVPYNWVGLGIPSAARAVAMRGGVRAPVLLESLRGLQVGEQAINKAASLPFEALGKAARPILKVLPVSRALARSDAYNSTIGAVRTLFGERFEAAGAQDIKAVMDSIVVPVATGNQARDDAVMRLHDLAVSPQPVTRATLEGPQGLLRKSGGLRGTSLQPDDIDIIDRVVRAHAAQQIGEDGAVNLIMQKTLADVTSPVARDATRAWLQRRVLGTTDNLARLGRARTAARVAEEFGNMAQKRAMSALDEKIASERANSAIMGAVLNSFDRAYQQDGVRNFVRVAALANRSLNSWVLGTVSFLTGNIPESFGRQLLGQSGFRWGTASELAIRFAGYTDPAVEVLLRGGGTYGAEIRGAQRLTTVEGIAERGLRGAGAVASGSVFISGSNILESGARRGYLAGMADRELEREWLALSLKHPEVVRQVDRAIADVPPELARFAEEFQRQARAVAMDAAAAPDITPGLISKEALAAREAASAAPITANLEQAKTGMPLEGTFFHGSGRLERESVFDPHFARENIFGPALYSTPNEAFAQHFGPQVERVIVKLKNPLVIASDAEWRAITREAALTAHVPLNSAEVTRLREAILSKGYDGVIVRVPESEITGKRLQQAFGEDTVVAFAQAPSAQGAPPGAVLSSSRFQQLAGIVNRANIEERAINRIAEHYDFADRVAGRIAEWASGGKLSDLAAIQDDLIDVARRTLAAEPAMIRSQLENIVKGIGEVKNPESLRAATYEADRIQRILARASSEVLQDAQERIASLWQRGKATRKALEAVRTETEARMTQVKDIQQPLEDALAKIEAGGKAVGQDMGPLVEAIRTRTRVTRETWIRDTEFRDSYFKSGLTRDEAFWTGYYVQRGAIWEEARAAMAQQDALYDRALRDMLSGLPPSKAGAPAGLPPVDQAGLMPPDEVLGASLASQKEMIRQWGQDVSHYLERGGFDKRSFDAATEYLAKVENTVRAVPDAVKVDMQGRYRGALDRALAQYKAAFVNYEGKSALDQYMRTVFPFWMYETRRWPYLMQQMGSKPALLFTLGPGGRYWDSTNEQGRIRMFGTDYEVDPFRGTIFGPLRRFAKEGARFEPLRGNGALDSFLKRTETISMWTGVWPSALVNMATKGIKGAAGEPVEFGESLPSVAEVLLDIGAALKVPGMDNARLQLANPWFDRSVNQELFLMGYDAAEIRRKAEYDRPSEVLVKEALRRASARQAILTEVGFSSFRPTAVDGARERRKVRAAILGFTPEDIQEAEAAKKSLGQIRPLGPWQREYLRSDPEYLKALAINQPLRPQAQQRRDEATTAYYAAIDVVGLERRKEQLADDADIFPTDPKLWRERLAERTTAAIQQVEGLKAQDKFFDRATDKWRIPVDDVARASYRREFGQEPPLTHPVDRLLEELRDIKPEHFLDPMTKEVQWYRFYDAQDMAIARYRPDVQAEARAWQLRQSTLLQAELREAKDRFRYYFIFEERQQAAAPSLVVRWQARLDKLSRLRTPEGIAQYEALKDLVPPAVKDYQRALDREHVAMRSEDPALDRFLVRFGYSRPIDEVDTLVEGIGPEKSKLLRQAGISSVDQLVRTRPADIAGILDVSLRRAGAIIDAARVGETYKFKARRRIRQAQARAGNGAP